MQILGEPLSIVLLSVALLALLAVIYYQDKETLSRKGGKR